MIRLMLQQIFSDGHQWTFSIPSQLANVEPYVTCALEAATLSQEPPQGCVSGMSGRIGPKTTVFDVDSNVGAFIVDKDRLAVSSQSNFSTIRANTCVYEGCWQYELMLGSKGVMQVGWTTAAGHFSQEKGVGDTPNSYAYDGNRIRKWNVSTHVYGESWLTGDVIGCTVDLDKGAVNFYRNGHHLGEAFSNVGLGPGMAYFPAVSLAYSENLVANFGASPFKYPVDGYKPLQKPPSVDVTRAKLCLQWLRKIVILHPDVSMCRVDGLSSKGALLLVAANVFQHLGPLLSSSYIVEAALVPYLVQLCNIKNTESLLERGGDDAMSSARVSTFLDLMWAFVEEGSMKACLENLAVALLTGYRFSSTLNGYSIQKLYLNLTINVLVHLRTRHYLLQHVLFDKIKFPVFLYVKPPDDENLKLAVPFVWWEDTDGCQDDGSSSQDGTDDNVHINEEIGSMQRLTLLGVSDANRKEIYFASILSLRKTVSDLENFHLKLLLLLMDDSEVDDKNQTSLSLFATKFREFLKENMVGNRMIPVHLCPLPVSLCFFHCLLKALRVLWDDSVQCELDWESGPDDRCVSMGDEDLPLACVPPSSFLSGGINYFENRGQEVESGAASHLEVRRLGGLASHLRKVYGKECSDTAEALLSRVARSSSESSSSMPPPLPARNTVTTKLAVSAENTTGSPFRSFGSHAVSSDNTLIEILDGVVLLYHIAAHKQLGKMCSLRDNMQEYVTALASTRKKLVAGCGASDRVEGGDVRPVLLQTWDVFVKKLNEQGRHMAWVRAIVYSPDKRQNIDWLLKVVLRTLNAASGHGNMFSFVPDFYVDVCINSCSSLTNFFVASDASSPPPPPSFSLTLVRVATFLSDHFMDKRIVSADVKDNLIQALASFVCRASTLSALEGIPAESRVALVHKLLQPYENRAWAQSNWILLRFWKGCGFAFRYTQPPHLVHKLGPKLRHVDTSLPHQFHKPCPSAVYQRHVADALLSSQESSAAFLNSVLNQLNWAFSEFVGMLQEIQNASNGVDRVFIDSRQLKICSTCFDLAVALLRVLEMVTSVAPQLFVDWSSRPSAEPLLARLCQLLCQVLNRVTSRSGCFDLVVGLEIQGLDSIDHFPIISAVVGILVHLVLDSDPSSSEYATAALLAEPSFQINSLEFVLGLPVSGTSWVLPGSKNEGLLSFSPQHKDHGHHSSRRTFSLKDYNEVSPSEVQHVERLVQHLWEQHSKASLDIKDASEEELCPICYAHRISAVFHPCGHQSCKACISHHLMNKTECFFCKSVINLVVSLDGKILHDLKQKQTTV